MAKRLYHCFCSNYPGAAIVIADDSAEPLEISGADIVHLPFNRGLSKGLIAALDAVKTEYVMRESGIYAAFHSIFKSNVHVYPEHFRDQNI
jgi:hypothetical protein